MRRTAFSNLKIEKKSDNMLRVNYIFLCNKCMLQNLPCVPTTKLTRIDNFRVCSQYPLLSAATARYSKRNSTRSVYLRTSCTSQDIFFSNITRHGHADPYPFPENEKQKSSISNSYSNFGKKSTKKRTNRFHSINTIKHDENATV